MADISNRFTEEFVNKLTKRNLWVHRLLYSRNNFLDVPDYILDVCGYGYYEIYIIGYKKPIKFERPDNFDNELNNWIVTRNNEL